MATATKKPSGLCFKRSGNQITFNWIISDKNYNSGQQIRWRFNTGKWSAWTTTYVATDATSRSISITPASYYPTTKTILYSVQFQIRGRRIADDDGTYNWSEFASNTLAFSTPNKPAVSEELDDTLDNVTTFSWSTYAPTTDSHPFYDAEYQTLFVRDSNVTDGSKLKWTTSALGWGTGSRTATGSFEITEDPTVIAAGPVTRWVRFRSRGLRGPSAWIYVKHVYAMPFVPTIKKAIKEPGTNLNWIRVKWAADAPASRPIDEVTVAWAIDTPIASLQPPASPTWNTERTLRDKTGDDETFFLVDQSLAEDQCLWVRVGVKHDRNERATSAKFVMAGALTTPTGLSVVTNASAYTATVTATNESEVPDSRLAVVFRMTGQKDIVVGVIPNGSTSVTVQCPDWSEASAVAIGVYAFQGTATAKAGTDGVTSYAINANMKSAALWSGGSVPLEPANVTAEQTDTEGEVLLTWDWTWNTANRAELSWSQNPNAWESTAEPSTYVVSILHAPQWRVSGLTVGTVWYFRIRLLYETDDGITYGPYCDPIALDLSSAPNVPILMLTDAIIEAEGDFTASWVYSSTDGTKQAYAEICEATVSDDTVTYGDVIAHTSTPQHIDMTAPEDWVTGSTYNLCVRVTSDSGNTSDWSEPAAILIANALTCEITTTSLETVTVTASDETTRTVNALTEMPLTATVTGAGEGVTTLIIERAEDYHLDRPDESEFNGYAGETVAIIKQDGEGQISVNLNDLIGTMDDGASYTLIATTTDGLGRRETDSLEFEVHWAAQAVIPEGTVEIVDTYAQITPVAPTGYTEGDTCDIYRLSADAPKLVIQGGAFGTDYVDPYPTIGEFGGYRFVYRTANGDYITADNVIAWLDVDGGLDVDSTIIDFDGRQVELAYDMSVSHSWRKDFTETTYLGGSVQGDWNPAVHRQVSLSADLITTDDQDLIEVLRRLAAYTGICHVRTVDGSSFAADVQVSENRTYKTAGKVAAFSISITQVEEQELDGMTLAEWTA